MNMIPSVLFKDWDGADNRYVFRDFQLSDGTEIINATCIADNDIEKSEKSYDFEGGDFLRKNQRSHKTHFNECSKYFQV